MWNRAAYTPGLPGSKCFSPNTLFGIFMFQAVTMFVTDVIILVIPMPILWRLKMRLKKRIGVMVLFGLGTLIIKRYLASLKILMQLNFQASLQQLQLLFAFPLSLSSKMEPTTPVCALSSATYVIEIGIIK
jgi:hypothetical protein